MIADSFAVFLYIYKSLKLEQGVKGSPVIPSHFQLVPAGLELGLRKPDRRLKCGFSAVAGSPGMCSALNAVYGFTSLSENPPRWLQGSPLSFEFLNRWNRTDKAARTLTLIRIFFPLLLFLVLLMVPSILPAFQDVQKLDIHL